MLGRDKSNRSVHVRMSLPDRHPMPDAFRQFLVHGPGRYEGPLTVLAQNLLATLGIQQVGQKGLRRCAVGRVFGHGDALGDELSDAMDIAARLFTGNAHPVLVVEGVVGNVGQVDVVVQVDEFELVLQGQGAIDPGVIQVAVLDHEGKAGGLVAQVGQGAVGQQFLIQPGLTVATDNLYKVLMDRKVRVGTSTPKADQSGDYAWELFKKADGIKAGSFDTLSGKALQLTGGPDSAKAPEGRNPYGWVMTAKQADVFLTYCTNAVLAQKEAPALQTVRVPDNLSVGADYGLIVRKGTSEEAWRLAMYILSPEGQRILRDYGFEAAAIPQED
jgi:hypothetical protein